ncbi:AMP-binding enzyme [Phytohabitans suffuscus]|uniref:AMP-binding enzyme C-terminal domain-containing protein n=1 Tax=Phytohabitans suffuscus TaxID=624315 RepID=A0A6F8YRS8_9ACTN|nr:hypothetical protein Psuf_060060 [Phytohabitans suffuscus]
MATHLPRRGNYNHPWPVQGQSEPSGEGPHSCHAARLSALPRSYRIHCQRRPPARPERHGHNNPAAAAEIYTCVLSYMDNLSPMRRQQSTTTASRFRPRHRDVVHPADKADPVCGSAAHPGLQLLVRQQYAAHAYPRRVHFVDALPKTPHGKIQRYLLCRAG